MKSCWKCNRKTMCEIIVIIKVEENDGGKKGAKLNDDRICCGQCYKIWHNKRDCIDSHLSLLQQWACTSFKQQGEEKRIGLSEEEEADLTEMGKSEKVEVRVYGSYTKGQKLI